MHARKAEEDCLEMKLSRSKALCRGKAKREKRKGGEENRGGERGRKRRRRERKREERRGREERGRKRRGGGGRRREKSGAKVSRERRDDLQVTSEKSVYMRAEKRSGI